MGHINQFGAAIIEPGIESDHAQLAATCLFVTAHQIVAALIPCRTLGRPGCCWHVIDGTVVRKIGMMIHESG